MSGRPTSTPESPHRRWRVDMSPEAIEARLQEVARLVSLQPPPTVSHGVDMSPEAVEARIEEACRLSELCFELMAAGRTLEPLR